MHWSTTNGLIIWAGIAISLIVNGYTLYRIRKNRPLQRTHAILDDEYQRGLKHGLDTGIEIANHGMAIWCEDHGIANDDCPVMSVSIKRQENRTENADTRKDAPPPGAQPESRFPTNGKHSFDA